MVISTILTRSGSLVIFRYVTRSCH